MRQHISKALKVRSQAIRNAVKKYNAAALAVTPQQPQLEIDTVLDYVFLAQFDLLRDSRFHVNRNEWMRPAVRDLMVKFFKLLRAKEEIERLNIEARCLDTFLHDSKAAYASALDGLLTTDPLLAHQLRKRLAHFESLN